MISLYAPTSILVNKELYYIKTHSSSKYRQTYSTFNREKIIWNQELISEYQELLPNLLVKSAKLVMKVRTPVSKPSKGKSRVVAEAEARLKNCHRKWKKGGKPKEKTNPLRLKYALARSNLQRTSRTEENLRNIRFNNILMHASTNDRNQAYSMMKKIRGERSRPPTNVLKTPT